MFKTRMHFPTHFLMLTWEKFLIYSKINILCCFHFYRNQHSNFTIGYHCALLIALLHITITKAQTQTLIISVRHVSILYFLPLFEHFEQGGFNNFIFYFPHRSFRR
jgi:hypothetical protein